MLNQVHVEGIVIARWRYNNTHFLRLAVYTDPQRGGRRAENYGRNLPDYVVLRCEGVFALVAANVPERARVSASGRLISRQHEEPLSLTLKRVQGDEKALQALREQVSDGALTVSHLVNEVLVERLELVVTAVRNGDEKGANPAASPAAKTAAGARSVA